MNSNNVVFNKSQDVVFRDNTDVVFRKREKLGIKEIKDSEIKKFVMASVQMCRTCVVPA
jgi:hypothetical protein